MLKTRLTARMDIRNDNLIKPVNCEGVRVVGNPKEYAEHYYDGGIDEILFMDAVASLYGRNSLEQLIMDVTSNVFVPVTVGGGIRSAEDVGRMLRAGADKVAINTAAVKRPELITEVAEKYGSQCMVLQIDAKKIGNIWEAYIDGGREPTGRSVIGWAQEAVELGAGEILLTSIDREGTKKGFDLDMIKAVTDAVSVPVIASGGAGNPEHVIDAVTSGANAVAVADMLHYRRHTIQDIKTEMSNNNIGVRHD